MKQINSLRKVIIEWTKVLFAPLWYVEENRTREFKNERPEHTALLPLVLHNDRRSGHIFTKCNNMCFHN